jgi:endoglycosylceramidase
VAGALRRTGAVAAALLVALIACAQAAAAAAPPLSQHGRWVTDASGRVVVLHGVNMVYKRPPYYPAVTGFGADDAQFLRREGFNTVRLGVIYAGVEPQPGAYDDAYLSSIATSFTDLQREGIFVMLDFHQDLYNERFQGEGFPDWAVQDDGLPNPQCGFPGNYVCNPALNRAFDHWWANDPAHGRGLQKWYADAWRHVAARFRAEPYLVGYDLLNEPWPGTDWPTCANPEGCPLFDTRELTPFSQRVYDRIREVDRRNVVWYEPNVIFNNGADTHHGDLGRRSGMSFHVYCLAEGSTPRPWPGDVAQQLGCDFPEERPFQNADLQSAQTGDALLLTEFGATDDLDQIERIAEKADEYMVGWQYWHYCPCDDPTTTGVGDSQAVVLDPSQPPEGANVKWDKLEVLARPYPQAVAGTPQRWDFDADTKLFELEYSTARAGAGTFRAGSESEIFLGHRHYPGGYVAEVRGGEVISEPDAEILRVRSSPGAREVGVTVRPR